MATIHFSWTLDNRVGTTSIKVKYRIKGTSIWTSFNVAASGTTATVQADANRIYDAQYQNINNADNPLSSIVNDIGFSNPTPTISPTNVSVGYSFANLSEDIDDYIGAIALFNSPNVILQSHNLTPADTVSDTFTGLTPFTQYYLYITPAADQFSQTFTYTFITDEIATCAAPQNVSASLL